MQALKNFFSYFKWDKSFLQNFIRLTIPLVLQNFVMQTLNIIDNIMISSLGDAAYAGVAQSNRFTLIAYVALFGVASGGAIFMSQFYGAMHKENMKKSLGLAISWGLFISIIILILSTFFRSFVASLFLQEGPSREYAKQYLLTIAPMFIFFSISNAFGTLLRSEGKTKYPMIAGVVSVISNTILNYLLIEGRFGFPRLEVVGAGLATLISTIIQCILMIYFVQKHSVCEGISIKEMFSFNFAFIKKYNKTCLPVILNESLWSIGVATQAMFYGLRGDVSAASMGVFNTVDSLCYIFIYSITTATAIVLGNELGSGNKDRAYFYSKRLIAANVVMCLITSALVIAFRYNILSLFSNLSQAAIELSSQLIIISGLVLALKSFNSILVVSILRAGGDTVASLVLDVVFLWGVAIPLLALATKLTAWPVTILYAISLSDELLKFIFGIRRYRSKKWLNNIT